MRQAGIALFGFGRRAGWRRIGELDSYQIFYCSLAASEAAFVALGQKRQRRLCERRLTQAVRQGAVWGGAAAGWRQVWSAFSPLPLVDDRPLRLRLALDALQAVLPEPAGREIAVLGVEDQLGRQAVDGLWRLGALPVVQGGRAQALADFYYREQGRALTVARGSRALQSCAARLDLRALPEPELRLAGVYAPPFAAGLFPCGLAAALLKGGAQTAACYP